MSNKNKITALVLSIATVSTMFTGVKANAVTHLETSEGLIEYIHTYGGGLHVYEGYKNEDQDRGIYFSNGQEDFEIEDVNTMGDKYGLNYIDFKDDNILFNLMTGQAEELDSQDKLDRMINKFKTTVLKKTNRYKNINDVVIGSPVVEAAFSPIYYEIFLSNYKEDKNYIVYLGEAGDYIDVSETLNITHYNTQTGEKVKLDKYSDLEKNGYVIADQMNLFMDGEDFYRLIIIANEEDSMDTSMYVQRISVEPSEKTKDGAKLPKKVESFEAGKINVFALLGGANIMTNKNWVIIVKPDLNEKGEKTIFVEKYNLKKEKREIEIDGKTVKLDMNAIVPDEDYDVIEDKVVDAYGFDLYGYLWILEKGKIKRLVDDEFETVFTTDRTMNNLSIFDENNFAVWNTEEEIYSIYNGNKAVSSTEEADGTEDKAEESVVTGWVKNDDGTWSFINADKTKKTGWYNDNGTWYMLKEDGTMATGWYNDNGTWYYLQESGAMKTGWFKDTDGRWYFMNTSGSMAHDTVIDGYTLGSNGALI